VSYPPINIPGLTLPDVPSVATNSAGPMLPEPVECGTPCGACEALAHEAARLREQVARQNETNRRIHTRCQIAEKAARDNVDACMRKGVSLSRGLSHFAYLKAEERAKESQTEIARLQMQVDSMCDAEELRQEREARKRAEAEVARLTHELSVATNWVEHHSQHASDLIGELARLREPNCTLVGFDATERTLTVQMDEPIMDRGWRLSQRATLAGEGGK